MQSLPPGFAHVPAVLRFGLFFSCNGMHVHQLCRAIVMVGDPAQLPATIFSNDAKRANYGQSLFQRLQRGGHPKMMLDTQYRMHPGIASFASSRFYDGLLRYYCCTALPWRGIL